MNKEFDIIIIGGGPAGLSAAIYASRGNRRVAVLDKALTGGQPNYYSEIVNYPGYISRSSFALVSNMDMQADSFGAKIFQNVNIERVALKQYLKEVITDEGTFIAPVIIIATGSHPKLLEVPEEEKFRFKGVSYCAVCDGGFYKGKNVAIIGGGNSALEEAMYLSHIAKKVYLIHRRINFRADRAIQEQLMNANNVEAIMNTTVQHIIGEDKVTGLMLSNGYSIEVDGVFPYIGSVPNSDLFTDVLETDKNGFITVNNEQQTSVEGVYAAGDVTNSNLKQVITAVAGGAKAATFGLKYLSS